MGPGEAYKKAERKRRLQIVRIVSSRAETVTKATVMPHSSVTKCLWQGLEAIGLAGESQKVMTNSGISGEGAELLREFDSFMSFMKHTRSLRPSENMRSKQLVENQSSEPLPAEPQGYSIRSKNESSHWLSWKKVLNGRVFPFPFDQLPAPKVHWSMAMDLAGSLGLDKGCIDVGKCFIHLQDKNLQYERCNFFVTALDKLDPFCEYQEYKFRVREPAENLFAALCEGRGAYKRGDIQLAIKCFEGLLVKGDNAPMAWFNLGLTHAAFCDNDQAICALKECILQDFSMRDAYLELASSFVDEGRFTSACLMLSIWLCMHRKYHEVVFNRITKFKFSFFSLAEEPRSPVSHVEVEMLLDIFFFIAIKFNDKATSWGSGSQEVDSKSKEKVATGGKESARVKSPKEEYAGWEGLEIDDPDMCTCLALLHIMANHLEDSEFFLREAIKNKKEDPKLWNKLGALQLEFGDYTGAIKTFSNALDIWPKNYKFMYNMAAIYHKIEDFRKEAVLFLRIYILFGNENLARLSPWYLFMKAVHKTNDEELQRAVEKGDFINMISRLE